MSLLAALSFAGIAVIVVGFLLMAIATSQDVGHVGAYIAMAGIVLFIVCGMGAVFAKEGDGHAQSPLHDWFSHLENKNRAPCCADADGNVVLDADWESKDGRYRVRIEGEWYDVPDTAVITEPNLDGRTIVWPIMIWNGTRKDYVIRCFIPGVMS